MTVATRKRSDGEHHDPAAKTRGLRSRMNAFVALLLVGCVVVPAVGSVLWLIGALAGEGMRALIVMVDMTAATILAGLALGIGYKVTKRSVPWLYWHVAVTVYLVGFSWAVTVTLGWSAVWFVIHFFGSLVVTGSWLLYRVDALRTAARGESGEDTWGKLLGLPRTKVSNPRDDGVALRATVVPGAGETRRDVEQALPKVESAADGLPGGTRVEWDPEHQRGEIVIQHTNPLRNWPRWPGPSNPGGSFADGAVAGVYADGTPEVIYMAAGTTADGQPRMPAHKGRMGTTRAGKSGHAAVEWVDSVFTRRDAVMAYADCAKPEQSIARPLLDDFVMYAETPPKVRAMFRALYALAVDRSRRMGEFGYRDWSTAVYDDPRLKIPAMVVAVDEAHLVVGSRVFTNLATVCLSTGIFLDVLLPRADHESMPPTLRFTIGTWCCFGTGDEYSETFAISEETRNAGAATQSWKASRPGYHYLDTAPGVDPRKYAMVARSYLASFDDLAAAARAGRAYRAVLPPEDIAALGDAWQLLQPSNARTRRPAGATINADERAAWSEEIDVDDDDTTTTPGVVMTADPDDEEGRQPVPPMDGADAQERAALAGIDARQPIEPPDAAACEVELTPATPRARNPQEATAELDRVLIAMADDGVTQFANADVLERCALWSDDAMAKRLRALSEGAVLSPPGLTVQRIKRGTWRLIYEARDTPPGDSA